MDMDSLVRAPSRAKAAVVDRLHPNWPRILRYSWSQRINAVAFVLTALEAVVPLYTADPPIPLRWFVPLVALLSASAFMARLVAQKNMGASE